MGTVVLNRTSTLTLVVGAWGGTGSFSLNNATLQPGSPVRFKTAPTLPATFNAGSASTYTLLLTPTVRGAGVTTLSIGMTLASGAISYVIPITWTAFQVTEGFILGVTASASSLYTTAVPQNTVNNLGITETMVGSKTAVHDANYLNMWLSANSTGDVLHPMAPIRPGGGLQTGPDLDLELQSVPAPT